VAGC